MSAATLTPEPSARAEGQRGLAERAAPLADRLRAAGAATDDPPHAVAERAAARLVDWCRSAAKGDPALFAKRLAWDGLDATAALRVVSPVGAGVPDDDRPAPAWTEWSTST